MIVLLLLLILLCLMGGPLLVFGFLGLAATGLAKIVFWFGGIMAMIAFWLLLEATAPKPESTKQPPQ